MDVYESKFTGKADIYDKFRPGYPEEFIDFLYDIGIIKDEDKIADIGCGTGILSNSLAKRNNTIIGIEPNLDMLRMAKQRLLDYSNCELINATAENTTLDDNSINCITVAQAFHWFNKEHFKSECQRILKEDGNVVLIWNSTDNNNPINIEIANINNRLCSNFNGYSSRNEETSEEYSSFFRDNKCMFKLFRNDLLLGESSFIGRNLSRSYAPNKGELNYNEYVDEIKILYKKYSDHGKIIVPNNTRCYIGKV